MFIASEADEHVQGPPPIVFQSRYNKSSGQKQHQRWRLKFQVGKALVDTCLTHPFEQFQWLGKNKRILFHQDETKKWYKKNKTKQRAIQTAYYKLYRFSVVEFVLHQGKKKQGMKNEQQTCCRGAAHLSGQKTGSLWNKLKMNEKGAAMTPYNVRPRETTALARVIGLAVVMERFDWLVAISPFLNIFDYSGRRCIGHHRMCGMHTEFSIIFFSVVPLPKLLSGSHQYSARRVEQGGRL